MLDKPLVRNLIRWHWSANRTRWWAWSYSRTYRKQSGWDLHQRLSSVTGMMISKHSQSSIFYRIIKGFHLLIHEIHELPYSITDGNDTLTKCRSDQRAADGDSLPSRSSISKGRIYLLQYSIRGKINWVPGGHYHQVESHKQSSLVYRFTNIMAFSEGEAATNLCIYDQ